LKKPQTAGLKKAGKTFTGLIFEQQPDQFYEQSSFLRPSENTIL
jgi:hypothetical protein